MLESATRNLEVVAPQGIALESRAGSIKASCLDDFVLHSTAGVIFRIINLLVLTTPIFTDIQFHINNELAI
ncbi:hypothetical protein Avbf_16462 [Armadillidium vulgare]|nr:hypothetical protein Avbf_16462 [Armadillidium vulgare]